MFWFFCVRAGQHSEQSAFSLNPPEFEVVVSEDDRHLKHLYSFCRGVPPQEQKG